MDAADSIPCSLPRRLPSRGRGPIFAADFTNDSKRSQASGANSSLAFFFGFFFGFVFALAFAMRVTI